MPKNISKCFCPTRSLSRLVIGKLPNARGRASESERKVVTTTFAPKAADKADIRVGIRPIISKSDHSEENWVVVARCAHLITSFSHENTTAVLADCACKRRQLIIITRFYAQKFCQSSQLPRKCSSFLFCSSICGDQSRKVVLITMIIIDTQELLKESFGRTLRFFIFSSGSQRLVCAFWSTCTSDEGAPHIHVCYELRKRFVDYPASCTARTSVFIIHHPPILVR